MNNLEAYKNFSEEISIQDRLQTIEESHNMEELRVNIEAVLSFLEDQEHLKLSPEVTKYYHDMETKKLLFRVGSFKRTIDYVISKKSSQLKETEEKFANCVIPSPEGVKIAFGEAQTKSPVRIGVGLRPSGGIGFSQEGLTVEEIDETTNDLRDVGLRKAYCRHISGTISLDNIEYLIMRIPRTIFPKERLTENEINNPSIFIFRGAKIENKEKQA